MINSGAITLSKDARSDVSTNSNDNKTIKIVKAEAYRPSVVGTAPPPKKSSVVLNNAHLEEEKK